MRGSLQKAWPVACLTSTVDNRTSMNSTRKTSFRWKFMQKCVLFPSVIFLGFSVTMSSIALILNIEVSNSIKLGQTKNV